MAVRDKNRSYKLDQNTQLALLWHHDNEGLTPFKPLCLETQI